MITLIDCKIISYSRGLQPIIISFTQQVSANFFGYQQLNIMASPVASQSLQLLVFMASFSAIILLLLCMKHLLH